MSAGHSRECRSSNQDSQSLDLAPPPRDLVLNLDDSLIQSALIDSLLVIRSLIQDLKRSPSVGPSRDLALALHQVQLRLLYLLRHSATRFLTHSEMSSLTRESQHFLALHLDRLPHLRNQLLYPSQDS